MGSIVGGFALLIAFVLIELHQERPMLDVGLLRRPVFLGVQISTFCLGAGMFALFPFLSIYPQAYGGRSITERVAAEFPRLREDLAYDRDPVDDDDSGQIETLPDGSISIPLFEEELLVTRRTVLRERVIVRKEDVTEWERVQADLRRERFEVDATDAAPGSVRTTRDE